MSRRPAPPPGFTLDDDEEDVGLPPPPPGYSLDPVSPAPAPRMPFTELSNAPRKSSDPIPWYGPPLTAPKKPKTQPAIGEIGGAIDGDTLSMSNGRNLRLYGVDAPELKQQGWNRQGQPVPIGQQSLANLNDILDRARADAGVPLSTSYGRPVAPVSVDGRDLGQKLARQGDALAAPRYLANDPQRRFEYLQAERLARQNGLGVHDTYHQSPEDFRHSPQPDPDRETVAQFWDTPTPLAGMRPEAERQYLALVNDPSVDPAKIVTFARENGFAVDPANIARVREQTRRTGLAAVPSYKSAPRPLTDSGDGALGAGVRGVGSGFLASGLDEVGAFVDTLGGTTGRENVWNSDRRLADIWSNNQQQNSSILGYDDLAHPYASTAGKVGGGVASSLIIPYGAGARTIPQLAKVGGVYGGAEGFLGTDGDWSDRAIGGAIGVPIGAALNAGGGKALEYGLKYAPRLAQRAGLRFPGRAPVDSPAASLGEFDGIVPPTFDDMAVEAAPRVRDVIDINDVPAPPPRFRMDEPEVVSAFYRGPTDGGRTRDIIDISEIPAPPAGYTLDRPRSVGNLAMAMDAEPSLSQGVARQPDYLDIGGVRPARMSDPRTMEQMRSVANDMRPSDVLPIPSNQVGSLEEAAAIEAGRFGPAKAPNEREELTRRTVRSWSGTEVPKVGPVDLVGWLRTQGGLMDQGGELSHMGLTNAARRMEFAGQEARFGPLVNNTEGMNLDDAAMRAWETGYFPDHAERPTTSEFLDALRDTHEGRNRHFLPDDFAEMDRFRGAQAERYDLEQRRFETGEPIFSDKSVPAGPDAPFPPPQAYEEWPAGGPDFVGNINMSKINTPQDISRAMSTIRSRVGFDAETRGRVTHAETERLAEELGTDPGKVDEILRRQIGAGYSAEEALFLRQIHAAAQNDLVNASRRISKMDDPGEEVLAEWREKLLRASMLQGKHAAAAAEAGRALSQFRMIADSRKVDTNVLAAFINGGGGPGRIKEAANVLIEAVENGATPGEIAPLVEKLSKPRWIDKAIELRYNWLLSGPQTHAANVISNTLTAISQIPEHAVASAIGAGRRVVMGQERAADRVYGSELGSRAYGLLQGTKEGLRQFGRTLRTGETSDLVSKVEAQAQEAISGLKGKIIRTPSRLLSAEDELFKAMARRMELHGLAARQAGKEGLTGDAAAKRIAELTTNPPDDMLEQSFDYARYLTFQRPLSGIPQSVSAATNKHPSLKFIVPFVRTPTNLIKYAAERSPAAPFVKEWRADLAAGGARRDLAIAKSMVGIGIAKWVFDLASDGVITGSPPADANKDRLLRADGWQPNSIKVGDSYYSYNRMDPYAMLFATAADFATKRDGMTERQLEDGAGLLFASVIKSLGDRTWLSGLSDLFEMTGDPQRNLGNYTRNQAASLVVPAGVNQVAKAMDPVRRRTDTVTDAIQSRVPGLSSSLYPQRDIYGREITTDRLGPDVASPVTRTERLHDPVIAEMMRVGASATNFRKQYNVGSKRVDYTPGEYDALAGTAGPRIHAALGSLFASPDYGQADDASRSAMIEKVIKAERKAAREAVPVGSNPPRLGPVSVPINHGLRVPLPPKGLIGSTSRLANAPRKTPTPPPGFTIEGEAGGRNVYADLQSAIPGVRFTSGFRTPEYQADMRRRGYKPASNSGHLDGTSLDMLPPPGKSMEWLKGEVRRYDPNAKLLIHDGHLHATFPGYYGAPVLGGAKGAKLKNPNAGMPPPPPGYKLN